MINDDDSNSFQCQASTLHNNINYSVGKSQMDMKIQINTLKGKKRRNLLKSYDFCDKVGTLSMQSSDKEFFSSDGFRSTSFNIEFDFGCDEGFSPL